MTDQPCAASDALRSAMSQSISCVAAAWRDVTWKHVALTFLLCLTLGGVEAATHNANFSQWWSSPSLNGVLSMQFNGFAVMLAVLVADRASPPSLRRWWPYILAVVVGVAVATPLFWLVSQRLFIIPSAFQLAGIPEGFDTIAFRHATSRLVICGLATYVYVSHRFAAQRLASLRIVQLERAAVERRVLESRLAAMQARVEPQFLLDTLAQVERLYDIDAQAADRVLKELTAYLRAAIPPTGDSAATVVTEIRLANAFLNIAGMRLRDHLVLSSSGLSFQHGARMPPMVVLPLVKHALTHRVERAQGSESFAIDVAVRNDKLLLTIRDRGTGFAPGGASDAEIRNIRERLAALYGETGQLTLKENGGGTEAIVEIPYEIVADAVPA
jgi:sensor histidine kinase YesM